ncbi:MAG: L-glutamate gamma-semialdehyde dehydrogenase [Syntrophomonadaceae bacterium]|nr:L-glutamate gamma-semialdehyde dehydrogenase [Syntrophomonadaceae bacterium]
MLATEFRNEAMTDFKATSVVEKMEQAITQVQKRFGEKLPLVINGEKVFTEETIESNNPACCSQIIGLSSKASNKHAEVALQAAATAFLEWQKTSAMERASYLFNAAAIMRQRKYELSALLAHEAGKNWLEADVEVAEAIDFLEFYGREALELERINPVTPSPGEQNRLLYIPLGVGVIISPWNFPLAILCGMTAGAIVTGNTAVVKPASNTPVIGYKFVEIMEEAGVPAGVINFVPGSGDKIGDYLVSYSKTRFINYTGSKEVGLHITELASKQQKGQKWIKRVAAEMGGKDAIIVDKDADLRDAARGVVTSAFGYTGQKCSACSRAIVDKEIYGDFLEMLVEETQRITVGPVAENKNFMGPVIDKTSYSKILEYINIGRKEGRLITGGSKIDLPGYFIEPTIIADVTSNACIAQEEIFGPVLAVLRANDFDHALEIANDTEFGLTGAVYSKNRAHLERAIREFHVGNLYFNRKCTGAMVGAHPFGGFNMSGTNSKTGGKDYLKLFTQMKLIAEKL